MVKSAQLLKFIQDLNPQGNPQRLAFYNFLKHYTLINEKLDHNTLNNFISWCLDFPHWAQNREAISRELRSIFSLYSKQFNQYIDTRLVEFPENVQIFEIDNPDDLCATIEKYSADETPDLKKCKVYSDQGRRFVSVELLTDESLIVRSFNRKFILRQGRLTPLRTFINLHYKPELELKENCVQTLETAPYVMAQFTIQDGVCQGSILRGYMFQRFYEISQDKVFTQPRIFYPLKRMEQFFIDRQTDSYYIETTQLVEKANELLSNKDPKGSRWAQIALQRGEMALESVYLGDKLLGLLLKDLRHNLNQVATALPPIRLEEEKSWETLSPISTLDLIN